MKNEIGWRKSGIEYSAKQGIRAICGKNEMFINHVNVYWRPLG